ncbi:MAG: UvrD-helicase domain-containing protein [Chloroflexi bacterium]|nr:UvrD-helicase domain-containing protein [Chloroflexota bacterium]
MSEPTPIGERRDEQQRAVIRTALDQTLFVEAGAGTGKTRALVDRFLALVLAGRPIDRIVAITFTEKAAAELRDRVRAGLEEADVESPEQQELVQAALASLDRAQISTIHGFALGLLRFFAAEGGIDPAFRVLDELQAERRLQERWRMYLEGLAADADAVAAIDRALALGLTTRDIEKLARELAGAAQHLALIERGPLESAPPDWPDLAQAQQALEAIPAADAPPGDRLRLRVEELLSLVRRLAKEGADREAVLAAGASVIGRKFSVGRQDDWGGKDEANRVRETAGGIAAQLVETLAGCRSAALADLLPLIARFVREDIQARGREGALTFDDLILRLQELLQTNAQAVRTLRDRYDALLIDEFQDTDSRQVEIALAFATDPESGRLEQGRLFLVGDPKQSIYRFRGADMAIYSRTRGLIEEQGGAFPTLALNRRSRQAVLEWVNTVFPNLIGAGDQPAVQPPYQPIYPERDDQLAGPGVAWFGGEMPLPAREVRWLDARTVARQCQAVLEEGWQVRDRDGAVRPARLGDIAVLIPTRSILAPLERAFAAAGIAFRVEGGSLLYRTQEIRDLINCLTAIDDPADEVAVVGALRSPAFACSDVDLARYRAAGGRFNYLARDLDGREGPVAEALRSLRDYHRVRHDTSLAALVERFAAERGLVEIGVLDQADRNSFRRVRYMVEQARAFEDNGPESLRSFAGWMERRAGEAMLDQEGGGMDDDEDAVRVLTIHGAKGLEFPIVFLTGLGASPGSRAATYGVDYTTESIAVTIGAKTRSSRFELGPVDAVAKLEQAHTEAEAARMLYVAATRARDHLVVSLFHSKRATRSWAHRLIAAQAREHAEPRPELSPLGRVQVTPFADLEVESPDGLTESSFEEGRAALLVSAQRQRYTSATALGPQKKQEATDAGEPWARGRGGTRIGRAVHAAIQSLPWDADTKLIEAFARAQAVAEAIPDRSGEVARLVRQALQSDAAGRARAAGRALREVPFAVPRDETILEGFVDLVIDTEDGIEIVDWKTDDVPQAAIPERLRQYELQAGLYVVGIEAATKMTVSRVTYVFVRAGAEASPGDPATLRALALSRLEEAGEAAPNVGL